MSIGKPVLTAILAGGLVAGTLDIGAAALISSLNPIIILHAVASGLLGKTALTGGDASIAVVGMLLQWAMSLIIAAIFVFAAVRRAGLARRWIAAGLGYGVIVFLVMNYVVVPLSQAPFKTNTTLRSFVLNLLAMLLFGLIIAFFARRLRSDT